MTALQMHGLIKNLSKNFLAAFIYIHMRSLFDITLSSKLHFDSANKYFQVEAASREVALRQDAAKFKQAFPFRRRISVRAKYKDVCSVHQGDISLTSVVTIVQYICLFICL